MKKSNSPCPAIKFPSTARRSDLDCQIHRRYPAIIVATGEILRCEPEYRVRSLSLSGAHQPDSKCDERSENTSYFTRTTRRSSTPGSDGESIESRYVEHLIYYSQCRESYIQNLCQDLNAGYLPWVWLGDFDKNRARFFTCATRLWPAPGNESKILSHFLPGVYQRRVVKMRFDSREFFTVATRRSRIPGSECEKISHLLPGVGERRVATVKHFTLATRRWLFTPLTRCSLNKLTKLRAG